MKIGRNDPCPCGSGKKYKKCCLLKENQNHDFLNKLNNLYATLKNLNNKLLKKANIPFYVGATFLDAINLTITSNALSLIKGVIQINYHSITNALNIRNIIECITLILMDGKGDLSQTQKDLFVEQYKLIEYESYAFDGGEKFKCMLDVKDLTERYEEEKNKFLLSGVTEKKLKNIANSRLPFLCKERISFNELIKKYCPEFLDGYIELSQMVHPSSYSFKRDYKLYDAIVSIVLMFLLNFYEDKDSEGTLTFKQEEALIYFGGLKLKDNYAQRLYDLQKSQWEELIGLSKDLVIEFGDKNYISDFINELVLVIHDLNTDSQLGYTENVKLKFKVIAEMLACFNKVYFGFLKTEKVSYFCDMLKKHEILKFYERANKTVPKDLENDICEAYKKNYSDSTLNDEQILKAFSKLLGFLMDEVGNSPTYTSLVKEYFETLYKDELMQIEIEGKPTQQDIKVRDYFALMYKESNNMSHGCGYLFFANTGAWMDDINIIRFLDIAILDLFNRISLTFFAFGADDEKNIKIAEKIKKCVDKLSNLFNEKNDIYINIPRVSKIF